MKYETISSSSKFLNRTMNIRIYGTAGYPVLAFPNDRGNCGTWESVGLIDLVKDYLDSEKIQLFCVDTVDEDGWLDVFGKWDTREQIIEAYYSYLAEEAIPAIREYTSSDTLPYAIGFGLGALNASIIALRRPDLIGGLLACSGCYDGSYYFNGHSSDRIYHNSPALFMENMPYDHAYVELYKQRKIAFCVGQSPYDKEAHRTANMLNCAFVDRGIRNVWVDFWGSDVTPEWDWWRKQLVYFLPWLIDPKRR